MHVWRKNLDLVRVVLVTSIVCSCGIGKNSPKSAEDGPPNAMAQRPSGTPIQTQVPTLAPSATPTPTLEITSVPKPGVTVSMIALGETHSCAFMATGGVKCWGNNLSGQLGDNSATSTRTPVDVVGLSAGVTALSVGAFHTCAITTSSGVKCWGSNDGGELGDNTTANRPTPVDVNGLSSGVKAISSGGFHTCALTATGGVKCWGRNTFGQLGDGTTTDRQAPVDVFGLTTGVKAISSGAAHTCAITTSGGVKCWGSNGGGELGDNTTTNRPTPVDVNGLSSGVTSISTGKSRHTCAITTSGGVKCWGDNDEGRLGDNTNMPRLAPVDVSGLPSGATEVSSGGFHTCALMTGSGVKCWGSNNNGQLGDNSGAPQSSPVDVNGLTSGVKSIDSGKRHSCALSTTGEVKCWGSNGWGQLGDGTETDRPTAVKVLFL